MSRRTSLLHLRSMKPSLIAPILLRALALSSLAGCATPLVEGADPPTGIPGGGELTAAASGTSVSLFASTVWGSSRSETTVSRLEAGRWVPETVVVHTPTSPVAIRLSVAADGTALLLVGGAGVWRRRADGSWVDTVAGSVRDGGGPVDDFHVARGAERLRWDGTAWERTSAEDGASLRVLGGAVLLVDDERVQGRYGGAWTELGIEPAAFLALIADTFAVQHGDVLTLASRVSGGIERNVWEIHLSTGYVVLRHRAAVGSLLQDIAVEAETGRILAIRASPGEPDCGCSFRFPTTTASPVACASTLEGVSVLRLGAGGWTSVLELPPEGALVSARLSVADDTLWVSGDGIGWPVALSLLAP